MNRSRHALWWAICVALFGSAATGGGRMGPYVVRAATSQANVEALPAPAWPEGATLADALTRRRSVREYAARPLTRVELATLLWSAQGRTSGDGHRTAPSAGALYPLRLYVVLASGSFRYEPGAHRLVAVHGGDAREGLWRAALQQDSVRNAPAVFVIAGDYGVTTARYGPLAHRFVDLEAGHAAQNLLLAATALGLGAVPIGAFEPGGVARAVGLPAADQPIELVPVGAARQ